MKPQKIILSILTAALAALAGWSAEPATNAAPSLAATIAEMNARLSKPARDVEKMVTAGVSQDVVKAFIDNSSAAYGLTPENIIRLQTAGVPAEVTTAMLSHDKVLRDQAALAQTPPPAPPQGAPTSAPEVDMQPAAQPVNTVSVYTIPSDSYPYYSDLASYGNWSCLPSYGWCWQPSIGLGYAYYPWNVLRGGRWWNCPGRGWVWFPGSHFRGTSGAFVSGRSFGSTRGFTGTRTFGGARGFAGTTGFGATQNHFRGSSSTFVTHHSTTAGAHFSGGFHSTSGGFGRASVGHSVGGGTSHSFGGHSFGGGRGGGGHR